MCNGRHQMELMTVYKVDDDDDDETGREVAENVERSDYRLRKRVRVHARRALGGHAFGPTRDHVAPRRHAERDLGRRCARAQRRGPRAHVGHRLLRRAWRAPTAAHPLGRTGSRRPPSSGRNLLTSPVPFDNRMTTLIAAMMPSSGACVPGASRYRPSDEFSHDDQSDGSGYGGASILLRVRLAGQRRTTPWAWRRSTPATIPRELERRP